MVTIKVGEEYTVELISNPSTGFSWTFVSSQLKFVSIEEFIEKANPNIVGSTVKTIFKIKGKQKGTEDITFNYHKVWEINVVPEKTETITVVVE